MRWEKRPEVLEYKGQRHTIKTVGWWCTQCSEGILTGTALKNHERAFLKFKAQLDGVLAPAEVASVREQLGLSQRKAGELLGGGQRAFQKYESGKQAVSAPMTNLLRLLANDPSRLEEIVRAKAPFHRAKARAAAASASRHRRAG
jgi:HTH-type transcriptional regulator/antitoxin MqsA